MIRITLSLILAIFTLTSTQPVFAYWASDIQTETNTSTATISIGSWIEIVEWVDGTVYQEGDLVVYDGIVYARTSDPGPGSPKEPDHPGWGELLWTEIP